MTVATRELWCVLGDHLITDDLWVLLCTARGTQPACDLCMEKANDEDIPCSYPVEAEYEGEHVSIVRCSATSIDMDNERCAEHLAR